MKEALTSEKVIEPMAGNCCECGQRNCICDDEPWWGHDPDLDENGICRICGKYEPE